MEFTDLEHEGALNRVEAALRSEFSKFDPKGNDLERQNSVGALNFRQQLLQRARRSRGKRRLTPSNRANAKGVWLRKRVSAIDKHRIQTKIRKTQRNAKNPQSNRRSPPEGLTRCHLSPRFSFISLCGPFPVRKIVLRYHLLVKINMCSSTDQPTASQPP